MSTELDHAEAQAGSWRVFCSESPGQPRGGQGWTPGGPGPRAMTERRCTCPCVSCPPQPLSLAAGEPLWPGSCPRCPREGPAARGPGRCSCLHSVYQDGGVSTLVTAVRCSGTDPLAGIAGILIPLQKESAFSKEGRKLRCSLCRPGAQWPACRYLLCPDAPGWEGLRPGSGSPPFGRLSPSPAMILHPRPLLGLPLRPVLGR